MSPQSSGAIAKLRHALRKPLNHIIGYAEIIREEAGERGAGEHAGLLEEIAGTTRRIVEMTQRDLPAEGPAQPGALDEMRARMAPLLQRILAAAADFESRTGAVFAGEIRKIRLAAEDLVTFAAGGDLPEPRTGPTATFHAEPVSPSTGRILIVDDDRENCEMLHRQLQRGGFTAAAESSGRAALDRLDRETFDVVLLDLFMPGINRLEVLAGFKADARHCHLPVIVLSALDDRENAVRSIAMGAEDFLDKPVDPLLLRARIGAVLKRRKVEVACKDLASSLELLLESTGEGIYGTNREGSCTFVNRAALEMLGYRREELLGIQLHARIHHTRAGGGPYPASECPLIRVLADGFVRRGIDEMLFRSDGSGFPVEYSAHPVRRRGEVDGVVVTFFDITERKLAQEHLLQSAKLESLGVLAGGVAHDFNNLLTGILGNASLALESLPQGDENRALLDEVMAAGERAADLTRQMLAFAGRGQFVLEPVNLSAAADDVTSLLRGSLPKQVRLSADLARDLPPMEGDLRQVQQLIFNLVINASEAIGERTGQVHVETGVRELPAGAASEPPFGPVPPGHYVFLAVEDTGPGIHPATRARIFEPFFSTKFTGRGLGLPAAMGIARAHRGFMRVESEAGRGSRFEVLFPRAAASAGAILVIDDEERVRRTTRVVLERSGYRVLLASDGQQGVEMFRVHASAVDLIVLDLAMQVIGGEEALQYLRAIRAGVPILVSSGYSESEVARRFAGAGVAGFLRKPYTAATLLQTIAKVLAKR